MFNNISLELGNFIRVKLGSTLLYKRNKNKKVAFFPLSPLLRMDGNYVKKEMKENERRKITRASGRRNK